MACARCQAASRRLSCRVTSIADSRAGRTAAVALTLSALLASCGGQSKPARLPGPPGKIEKLREEQEAAQSRIEAEGRQRAREVEREREATRREAEREAG
jgi:hypothetical protein